MGSLETSTTAQRIASITRFRHLLVDRANRLTDAVWAEVQRPPSEVLATDILPTAAAAKYLQKNAARLLRPIRASRAPLWLWGVRAETHFRPWGRVGIIGTWNYPIYLSALPIMQALAAGNVVLFKPSEKVPRTCAVLAELFWDAGFTRDQLQLLPATREAGPELLESKIDYLHFTGSEDVGRKIAKRLGERLIPSTMELSGVDAVFVLADADVEQAAQAVWYGVTLNGGQTCLAVRRVFIDQTVYAKFVDLLTELCAKTPKLTTVCDDAWLTAITTDALARGARLLPTAPGGNLAMFVDAPPDLLVAQESGFGPACAVTPVDSIDHAVSLHNACRFGLAASVYSADPANGQVIASRLNVGTVIINDVIAATAHPGTPFGGRGASGWGVSGGAEGLRGFTCPQVVVIRSGQFRPHIEGAIQENPHVGAIVDGLLRSSHAQRFANRVRGYYDMVRAMIRFGKKKP